MLRRMAAPAHLQLAGDLGMATFREPVGRRLRLRICAGVSIWVGRPIFAKFQAIGKRLLAS
jgi:hypothetical protein